MRHAALVAALVVLASAGATACGGPSKGSTPSATATPSATSSAAARGATVWRSRCIRCHAPDPAAVGVADAAAVKSVVESGTDGMPAFAGRLPAADIDAVSAYVAAAAQ